MHRRPADSQAIMPGERCTSPWSRGAGGRVAIASIVKQVQAPGAHLRLEDGAPDFEGATFVLDALAEGS